MTQTPLTRLLSALVECSNCLDEFWDEGALTHRDELLAMYNHIKAATTIAQKLERGPAPADCDRWAV